jgi:hypothetical protein
MEGGIERDRCLLVRLDVEGPLRERERGRGKKKEMEGGIER